MILRAADPCRSETLFWTVYDIQRFRPKIGITIFQIETIVNMILAILGLFFKILVSIKHKNTGTSSKSSLEIIYSTIVPGHSNLKCATYFVKLVTVLSMLKSFDLPVAIMKSRVRSYL